MPLLICSAKNVNDHCQGGTGLSNTPRFLVRNASSQVKYILLLHAIAFAVKEHLKIDDAEI
jgi:hypothetical protein